MKALKYEIQEFGGGYRVYVGNGKFRKAKTKLGIEKIVAELKATRGAHGKDLSKIPSGTVANWRRLNNLAEQAGTTLQAAVDHWLLVFAARKAAVPFATAVADYLVDAKNRLKPPTLREKTQRLNAWVADQAAAHPTLADACDVDVLRKYLNAERKRTTDQNHKNIWAVVSAFCSWCVSRRTLAENPCDSIDTYLRGKHKTIAVFSPDEVAVLLKVAVEKYNREILSYLVLSLFGGLRPYEFVTEDKDGVWHHLEWKAIGKDIVKGATLCKTQLARRVPVGKTLQQWIEFIRKKEGGSIQGRVVGGFAFYQRLRKWKRAYLPENIVVEHDVLRHCYGTYRAVLLGEVGKVAMEMGNSEATVKNYYLDGKKSPAEADEFWSLTPKIVMARKKKK